MLIIKILNLLCWGGKISMQRKLQLKRKLIGRREESVLLMSTSPLARELGVALLEKRVL